MFRTSHMCTLILMVVLLGTTVDAVAQKSTLPTGTWSGILSGGKAVQVRVQVNFQPNGAQLHFYAPLSCLAQAGFVQSTSNGSFFTFKQSTTGGAFCDKLYPGKMTVNKPSQSGMAISLTNAGAQWSGILKPGA
ncbi:MULTISPECIES: hypothetical protein [unclassified Dyella]|uniref:hypothetical protein n=1 Tax=unclassified Dyella TaxID=2634549 RepID=UPI003F8FF123